MSKQLIDVLDRIEDYLEARQDVRDGSDGVQLPNAAMSLLTDLAEARTQWARESLRPEVERIKHPANEALLDGLIELVAENGEPPLEMARQMVRDAKRYRWLRMANRIMPGAPGMRPIEWYCGEAADVAIDKAMLLEPQRERS